MSSDLRARDWEGMFAPYDQAAYQAVLALLGPGDVVLDIGAGDLRLSRQMAAVTHKVYAVEKSFAVMREGLGEERCLPGNLVPICADAQTLPFPSGISVGVLMMRHCTHYRLYAEKCHAAGAKRIITNARWHMDVEAANLEAERIPYR
ncbi:MAG TPA: methyltransferase domain-containing protein, partial [Anaerolineales bacterium]